MKESLQKFPQSRINQFHFSLTSLSPNTIITLPRTDINRRKKSMREERLGGSTIICHFHSFQQFYNSTYICIITLNPDYILVLQIILFIFIFKIRNGGSETKPTLKHNPSDPSFYYTALLLTQTLWTCSNRMS